MDRNRGSNRKFLIRYPLLFLTTQLSERLVVDPSFLEEQVQEGDMTVVVNSHRELCTLSKNGGSPLEVGQVLQCAEVASVKAAEVTELIRSALAKVRSEKAIILSY
jgi:exosome complex RNA-binding protein Rrp42 (RNase PH superfamily)